MIELNPTFEELFSSLKECFIENSIPLNQIIEKPWYEMKINKKIIEFLFPYTTITVKYFLPNEKEKINEPDIEGYVQYMIDFNEDCIKLKIIMINSTDSERIGTYDWKAANNCEIFLGNYLLLISSLAEIRSRFSEYIPNYLTKLEAIKTRNEKLKLIESL